MEQIGIKVSDEDKVAYYYNWKVIGQVMGIQKEFIPENYEKAELLEKKF